MPKRMDRFLDELRVEIRRMTPQSRIYHVLREELTHKGYWKRKSRGNPRLGYRRMQEVRKQKAQTPTPTEVR